MATTDQIKALITSHVERDEGKFRTVAMQVAAQAARQGHGRVADEIRQLVDRALATPTQRRPSAPIPIASPRGELAGLLAISYPDARLADLVLSPEAMARLERVLRETRALPKLREAGLLPRRKLLLVGPPGCGKTLTAAVLAGELHLPLHVVVLDSLITKFMGETAAKLRLVFDMIATSRGVYLFDEFDALGYERGAGTDVGEMRRILNSFLMLLEQDTSDSLIVAATNHGARLDPALFRRFDDVLAYQAPDEGQRRTLIESSLANFDTTTLNWPALADSGAGLSHAEIVAACQSAAKGAVLDDRRSISTSEMMSSLAERRGPACHSPVE